MKLFTTKYCIAIKILYMYISLVSLKLLYLIKCCTTCTYVALEIFIALKHYDIL